MHKYRVFFEKTGNGYWLVKPHTYYRKMSVIYDDCNLESTYKRYIELVPYQDGVTPIEYWEMR